jgi:hypothetical protein
MPKTTDPLIEKMAMAIAPHLEGGRDFDRTPADRIAARQWFRQGMCAVNDATQDDAREAAQAALSVVKQHMTSAESVERASRAVDATACIGDFGINNCNEVFTAALLAALKGNDHE